jgi:hypothetical protein
VDIHCLLLLLLHNLGRILLMPNRVQQLLRRRLQRL